ncbi:hypothetical protein FOXYSP1_02062 [Fusarium oxysporum f. sp. phaseoli]|nr:hypothetical protein FOMA001_g1769 [Fusarium oxysporum f. sp. matthiolae]
MGRGAYDTTGVPKPLPLTRYGSLTWFNGQTPSVQQPT